MKLSIIVPVYNVEKYIVKCISSLLCQDTNDYELIIVNDGTKDKSIELIEEHFNDDKIKIVNQENKGLSGARNTGLEYAKGEYVWFFDSDDWLDKNVLDNIIVSLVNCDILYFSSYYTETTKGSFIAKNIKKYENGRELSLNIYFHPVQFYIYNRDFIQNVGLMFKQGIYHEDTLFTPQILYQSNIIKRYKKPVYHLLRREGSISQSFNPKRCYDLMAVISELMIFAEKNVPNHERYKWGNCIADAINEVLYLTRKGSQQLKDDVRLYMKDNSSNIYRYMLGSRKIPTKILGCLSYCLKVNLVNIYTILYHFRYG